MRRGGDVSDGDRVRAVIDIRGDVTEVLITHGVLCALRKLEATFGVVLQSKTRSPRCRRRIVRRIRMTLRRARWRRPATEVTHVERTLILRIGLPADRRGHARVRGIAGARGIERRDHIRGDRCP